MRRVFRNLRDRGCFWEFDPSHPRGRFWFQARQEWVASAYTLPEMEQLARDDWNFVQEEHWQLGVLEGL